jgi:hypothetical protein
LEKQTYLTQQGIDKVKAELFDIERVYVLDAINANDTNRIEQLRARSAYLAELLANCIRIETKTPIAHTPSVEEVWRDFWAEIVCDPKGNVNVEQVKKELYDFKVLIDNARRVYCHVTGDTISKVMTDPNVVIQYADEHYMDMYEALREDEEDDADGYTE